MDPKPTRRVRDGALLALLHREWKECVLCGLLASKGTLSLHHVHKHPRSDLRENLVMLCGDGTSGCHGDIEHGRGFLRRDLVTYLRRERPDVFQYLSRILGGSIAADEWLRRYGSS